MKNALTVIVLLAILGAAVPAVLLLKGSPAAEPVAAPAAAPVDTVRTLSVKDMQKGEGLPQGEFAVTGVVGLLNEDKGIVGLIDAAEANACGDDANACVGGACFTFTLPVKWSGDMPEMNATVVARGSVEKTDEGLFFKASGIETQ